jgi:hypothetical protein
VARSASSRSRLGSSGAISPAARSSRSAATSGDRGAAWRAALASQVTAYQVRKHQAWYRHVTLALAAQAWLAVAAARPPRTPPGDRGPAREGAPRLWTTIRPAPSPW